MVNSDELVLKREALLDAAAYEFDRHGYDGTRIQDFLNRAGVTKGGMYHYFAAKWDLGQAVIDLGLARWRAVLAASTESEPRGLEGLSRLMRSVAEVLRSEVRVRAAVKIAVELDHAGPSPFELWHDAISLRLQQAIVDRELPDSLNVRETGMDLVDFAYGVCTTLAPWGKFSDVDARLERMLRAAIPDLRSA